MRPKKAGQQDLWYWFIYGPLIKDLDEDILANASEPSTGGGLAAKAIRDLSSRIKCVDEILTVLSPRHTFESTHDQSGIGSLLKLLFSCTAHEIYMMYSAVHEW